MDPDTVSNVSKLANRKRIREDVEKLKERVSGEASKIIKLRVAQDTAYWDLKEKLQAVEANHERLQANMVDVQMQHEAISTSYQAELLRRAETLNQLAASRAMANALEENSARLRECLRRQAADCAALQSAYRAAAQRTVHAVAGAQAAVRAQRAAFSGAVDREREAAERARSEAVRAAALASVHCEQAESARREAAGSADRAAAATAEANELREALQRMQRDFDQAKGGYALLIEENNLLKSRNANSAQLLREVEGEKERLNGELAATRDHLARIGLELETAQAQVTRLTAECVHRDAEREADKQRTAAELEECGRIEAKLRAELEASELRAAAELQERKRVEAELCAEREAREQRSAAEQEERGRLEVALAKSDERVRVLTAELEEERVRGQAAAADLVARADTISALMREINIEAEARARVEDTVKLRDAALRKKESELEDQMKMIQDMRAEKERLQEKINSMQGTIENIQKELVRDTQPAHTRAGREPAQRDTGSGNKKLEDMLFSFHSEDSEDTISIDAVEVDRRFAELARTAGGGRGEPLSLTELRAQRPSGAGASRSIFKHKRRRDINAKRQ